MFLPQELFKPLLFTQTSGRPPVADLIPLNHLCSMVTPRAGDTNASKDKAAGGAPLQVDAQVALRLLHAIAEDQVLHRA